MHRWVFCLVMVVEYWCFGGHWSIMSNMQNVHKSYSDNKYNSIFEPVQKLHR